MASKWDDRSDADLRELVAEHGKKWNGIFAILGELRDVECQNRWMFLSNHERLN
jgi:hypothetical protein